EVVGEVESAFFQVLPGYSYDPRRSFRAYLKRATYTKLIDLWRERSKERHVSLDNAPPEALVAEDDLDRLWNMEAIERAERHIESKCAPKTFQAYVMW